MAGTPNIRDKHITVGKLRELLSSERLKDSDLIFTQTLGDTGNLMVIRKGIASHSYCYIDIVNESVLFYPDMHYPAVTHRHHR